MFTGAKMSNSSFWINEVRLIPRKVIIGYYDKSLIAYSDSFSIH